MTQLRRRTALLGASAAMLAPLRARAQGRLPRPPKIGFLSDFNSLYSVYSGTASLTSARFAIEDFQARNPGFAVDLISADHQNKPDIAAAIANKWCDEDGVDMITDVPLSACVLAVENVVKAKNRLLLATNGNSPVITNENCNANTAQWPFSSQATGNAVINALLAQGTKTFFFITVDNATGAGAQNAAEALIKAKGGNVVGVVRHPFGAPDFSSYILAAQQSGADAIVMANAGPDVVSTVRTARDFGVTKKQKLAALVGALNDVHSMGLPLAQGLTFADAWYWDLNDETRAFAQRLYASNNHTQMPNGLQASTYSAVTHYLNAVKATGTLDAATVMAQMKRTGINDLFAKNAYIRDDGRVMHDLYFLRVKSPEESKGPWDYLALMNVIPANEAFPLSEASCPLLKKA